MTRHHRVEPGRQKQDVGSRHDEDSARLENPGQFGQYGDLVVDMLDAFGVQNTLEGVVFIGKWSGHVTAGAGKTVGPGPVGKEVGTLHFEA